MATVSAVEQSVRDDRMSRVASLVWTPLTSANAIGDSKSLVGSRDRSVQFAGTWDSATIVLQGSNDGTNWHTLNDPLGTDISATANALFQILECTRYIRPSGSGGGGSSSVTVTVFCSGDR